MAAREWGGPEGRTRRYRIGKHGEMTAEQARERARRLRVQVSDGVDPFAERARQREIPTVADLGERYMAEHALVHKRASSVAEDRRNLDNHIVPLLGHLKASAVTAEDVARMVRGIAAGDTARDEKTEHGRCIVKGGKIAANRARALLSTMMNLAETWGYRPRNSNPCGGARRFIEEKRQRFLTGDELSRLGRTLAAAETEGLDRPAGENRRARKVKENPATIAAIRLLLFTGCRLSEIRTLKWSHVDTERANEPLPSLAGRLISLAKLVVACLNIGSIGYFWFQRPGFEQKMFKDVRDLELKRSIDLGRGESFWGNGRAVALTDKHIDHAIHCMMAFAPLSDAEAEPIFKPYFHGLALIAKSDIFYSFDVLARHAFVASLAGALRHYGGWNGNPEEFEARFHEGFSPFMPNREHRDRMFRMLTPQGDPTETPLVNLRSAKQLADLYLIHKGRQTWRTILDRSARPTA